jgi:hypothetical protein
LTLRSCALSLSVLGGGRGEERSVLPVSPDIFFMAILNRITGRPGLYQSFHKATFNATQSSQPVLPKIEETKEFLNYVQRSKIHGLLFNHQHIAALPGDFKKHISVFVYVVDDIARTCESLLKKIYIVQQTRKATVVMIGDYLMNSFEKFKLQLNERALSRHKYDFLSHQIVADLEEIYHLPFGDVTLDSVIMGSGSKQGSAACTKMVEEINSDKNTTGSKSVGYRDVLQYVSSLMEGYLQNDSLVKILGCVSSPDGGTLVRLNKRPINFVDGEHFLCKLYVCLAKTIGQRATSKRPSFRKAGHHPVNFLGEVCYWDDENVRPIMMDMISEYENLQENGQTIKIPDILILPGESECTKK